MPAGSVKLDELDVEDEGGVGRDHAPKSTRTYRKCQIKAIGEAALPLTVRHVRGDGECALLALAHALQALIPALDNLASADYAAAG